MAKSHQAEPLNQYLVSGKISGDGIFTRKCHQFLEARYGFKKTSMDDVAQAAGVSRQGLYLYFDTKEWPFALW